MTATNVGLCKNPQFFEETSVIIVVPGVACGTRPWDRRDASEAEGFHVVASI